MFSTNFKKICCSFASRCQETSTFWLSATQATVLRKKEIQDGGHVLKRLLPQQQFLIKT